MSSLLRALPAVLCALWLATAATGVAARSDLVLRAQERLDALGLSPGPIDGVMGDRTRSSLRLFQQNNGLAVTGELDWPTQTALSASVRKAEDVMPPPRAVPVPKIAIEPLPPPSPPTPSQVDATSLVSADSPVAAVHEPDRGWAIHGPEPAEPAGTLALPATAPMPAGTPAAPAPASVDADGRSTIVRAIPAMLLGLAAACTWLALIVWWLRQRPRRRASAETGN